MGKKYYAVCMGRIPGVYDNWEETKKQVDGFKNAKFKGFKTKEEAIAYMAENKNIDITDVVEKHESKITVAMSENGKRDAKEQLGFEDEMIRNGSWKEYLFRNITCEDLMNYDALCVSDASENEDEKTGSFGLIIIPLKNGKRCGNVIVESALLKDKTEDGKICEGKFERKRFTFEGKEISEEIILEKNLWKEGGYVATGYADRAESESAVRILELCKENGYVNILYISDCQPLLQAINKGSSTAVGNIRVLNAINAGKIVMELRKVGSHSNAFIGELNDVGKEADDKSKHGRTHVRLFYLLNDLTDLLAKAEVPAKKGSAASENKVSIHLIPDKNGNYIENGMKSDMQEIYNKELSCEKRRIIAFKMVKRIIPLIDQALENSQA